jgi:hypothetical protein
MRLTDFALLWIIIISPFQLQLDWQLQQWSRDEQSMIWLERMLQAATDDATFVLSQGLGNDAVIDRFYRSLSHLTFGSIAVHSQAHRAMLVIVEHDGYRIVPFSKINPGGERSAMNLSTQAKRYFTATDREGNTYRLANGESMSMHHKSVNHWLSGSREELYQQTNVQLLSNETSFKRWKQSMMMEQLQRDIQHTVGGEFEFAFPNSDQSGRNDAEYGNISMEEGLIACLQADATGIWRNTLYALSTSKMDEN